jgi:hypothetical protein
LSGFGFFGGDPGGAAIKSEAIYFFVVSAVNCRQKPARIPYSCRNQFGTSGNNGCPHCRAQDSARHLVLDPPFLDIEDAHTASFLPPGVDLGRSICA